MDLVKVGVKHGLIVYASENLIAREGIDKVRRSLDVDFRSFPVKVDLSGNVVFVEARSHEEAIEKFLQSKSRCRRPQEGSSLVGHTDRI